MKNRVFELRRELKLSQQKLGELVGVSRQTINSLENDKYDPSIKLAFKLAEVFDKQIEEVFIYEGE